jgi:hypothetical protein
MLIITTDGSVFGSHGLSTGRKIGIALGTLFGCAAIAGMLVFLYRRRHPSRQKRLGLLRLYRTHRRGSKNSSMVGLTDTEDGMKLDSVPSLSKSQSMDSRRESVWKNLEDYDYDD